MNFNDKRVKKAVAVIIMIVIVAMVEMCIRDRGDIVELEEIEDPTLDNV